MLDEGRILVEWRGAGVMEWKRRPAAETTGMGLANLQRRAAKHGGGVRIDTAPAQGTTLTITLPVHD